MKKTMGEFTLGIKGGEFTDSEIMVMLGENGEFTVRINECESSFMKVLMIWFVWKGFETC